MPLHVEWNYGTRIIFHGVVSIQLATSVYPNQLTQSEECPLTYLYAYCYARGLINVVHIPYHSHFAIKEIGADDH